MSRPCLAGLRHHRGPQQRCGPLATGPRVHGLDPQQMAQLVAAWLNSSGSFPLASRSWISRSGSGFVVEVLQEPGADDPFLGLGQEVPGQPEEGVTPASTALTWR